MRTIEFMCLRENNSDIRSREKPRQKKTVSEKSNVLITALRVLRNPSPSFRSTATAIHSVNSYWLTQWNISTDFSHFFKNMSEKKDEGWSFKHSIAAMADWLTAAWIHIFIYTKYWDKIWHLSLVWHVYSLPAQQLVLKGNQDFTEL